ncbi:TetR/AcrR family transcriptional regulator [Nocardia sp. BMG51109]|uniref:TetR/AcrR family transcriptional regulator n=1 Tax=Nocardia sp. BMG51109 TaxID=1056816 RepID=UPI00055E75DD|nr:TetR/AcrR family transcriptional regulator [Nocardia sp. BMG51109]
MTSSGDVAGRIARRSLAGREASYAGEVRRLLDAALELMRVGGIAARPRVADIVAAAGLSNDAFYRHFRSKDALVEALLEDGADRLRGYVAHRMGKQGAPEARVRAWVTAVLRQAGADTAATTRAVLWNAGGGGAGLARGSAVPVARLAPLLHGPFAELGSADPEFDASLAAHATIGLLADFLRRCVEPADADVDRVTAFCLRTARSGRS